MLNIKYKDKPTKEAVERYCRKIEEFLSAHRLKVGIVISDSPCIIKSYWENKHVEDEYIWIKNVIVEIPGNKLLSLIPPRNGIEDDTLDREIWDDAASIQDDIYRQLNINFRVGDMSDPYWNLWSKFPK